MPYKTNMRKRAAAQSSKAFKIAYAFVTRGGIAEPATDDSPYASVCLGPRPRYHLATSAPHESLVYGNIPKEVRDAVDQLSLGEVQSLIALKRRLEKKQTRRLQTPFEEVVFAREATRA
jgi:hypothetical protein